MFDFIRDDFLDPRTIYPYYTFSVYVFVRGSCTFAWPSGGFACLAMVLDNLLCSLLVHPDALPVKPFRFKYELTVIIGAYHSWQTSQQIMNRPPYGLWQTQYSTSSVAFIFVTFVFFSSHRHILSPTPFYFWHVFLRKLPLQKHKVSSAELRFIWTFQIVGLICDIFGFGGFFGFSCWGQQHTFSFSQCQYNKHLNSTEISSIN